MKTENASTSLTLNGLRLSVHLGIYPEELVKKQVVNVDLRLWFPHPPKACFTDRIEDTFCYDRLISYLKEKLQTRRFQMIEHFGQELHVLVKSYFPTDIYLNVKVTKMPSNPDLTQGVTFEYGILP